MTVHVVTGKLGAGKTLVAVSRIQRYLNQGRFIVTNLDLNLEYLINPFAKQTNVIRVPDRPSVEDFESLPSPYQGDYSEEKSGLIVLDECATWFNSRTWNEKGRKAIIDWLLHARKLGWDIIFIIQNVSMMDSQAREGFAEHVVHCRRLDRLSIPFITPLTRYAGLEIRPPKLHWGIVKYGSSDSSPMLERWTYTGTDLYNAYDTRQVFQEDSCAIHSMLPPHTIYGRYTSNAEHTKRRLNRSINKFLATAKPRATFFIGLMIASLGFLVWPSSDDEPATIQAKVEAQKQVDNVTISSTPFDGVVITASVKGTTSFDYIFQRGDDVVYPEHMGFKVRYVSECKASLTDGKSTYYLTCSPYRSPSSPPQPREGDVGGRDELIQELASN